MEDFFDCLFDETPFATAQAKETEEEKAKTEAEAPVFTAEGTEAPAEPVMGLETAPEEETEKPVPDEKAGEGKNEYMLDTVKFGLMTQGKSTAEKAACKLDFFGEKIAKAASGNAIGNWAGLIAFLKERCMQDTGLAEDVLQEHKTVERCVRHVLDEARNEMKKAREGKSATLSDETVFEWAEDYFRKDDLEEARKAEQKKKSPQKSAGRAVMQEKKPVPAQPKQKKDEVPQQMDFFSMFGEG